MKLKKMYLVQYEKWGSKTNALFEQEEDAQAFAELTNGLINFLAWEVEITITTKE